MAVVRLEGVSQNGPPSGASPDEPLPPLQCVVMTHQGTVIFTDVTGEIVEDDIGRRFYPDVSAAGMMLVWTIWRKPGHDELVKAWPARWPADAQDLARGWRATGGRRVADRAT